MLLSASSSSGIPGCGRPFQSTVTVWSTAAGPMPQDIVTGPQAATLDVA